MLPSPSLPRRHAIASLAVAVVLVVAAGVVSGPVAAQPDDETETDTQTQTQTQTPGQHSTSTTGVTTNGISGLLVGVAAIVVLWYRRRRGR